MLCTTHVVGAIVDRLAGKRGAIYKAGIDTTKDVSMSKRQSVGLIFMIGSAAAAIQMTLFFSPIMRGWFYSICLGVLAIVFASGADMFRGNE